MPIMFRILKPKIRSEIRPQNPFQLSIERITKTVHARTDHVENFSRFYWNKNLIIHQSTKSSPAQHWEDHGNNLCMDWSCEEFFLILLKSKIKSQISPQNSLQLSIERITKTMNVRLITWKFFYFNIKNYWVYLMVSLLFFLSHLRSKNVLDPPLWSIKLCIYGYLDNYWVQRDLSICYGERASEPAGYLLLFI